MRKIFTFALLASLLAGGSVYAAPQKMAKRDFNPEKRLVENVVKLNDKKFKSRQNPDKLQTRADEEGPVVTPVITDPEGTYVTYRKESIGITTNWLLGSYVYQGSNPSIVVWGENDEVYISDIISDVNAGTYVKGSVSEGKITMDLPQTILFYEDMEFGFNLVMLKKDYYFDELDGQEYLDYIWDESITSVEFIMGEDGYFYLDLPGGFDGEDFPDYALGLVYTDVDPLYNGIFAGYCDFAQEYYVFTQEPNEIPEDLSLEPYAIINEEDGLGYLVNVGFDEDTVYFQGLSNYMPEGIVIGSMQKNEDETTYTVKISQNQYLGLFEGVYFIFTKAVTINPNYDEDDPDSIYAMLAPEDAEVELIYDPEAKSFTYAESPYMLCLNTSMESLLYLEIFNELNLNYQASLAGTPVNPEYLIFIPFAEYYGFDVFDFKIPNVSTEGTILDMNNLYYSIFIDGEIMTFEEEETVDMFGYDVVAYLGITEPTVLLPLTFSNGNDIWTSGISAEVGIYFEGFTTLGVQSVYIYDGVTTKSDIVEFNVETGEVAGVNSLDINSATIVSSEFYDLNGRKISHPDKGIYIMKSKLSDGNVVVKKVARR